MSMNEPFDATQYAEYRHSCNTRLQRKCPAGQWSSRRKKGPDVGGRSRGREFLIPNLRGTPGFEVSGVGVGALLFDAEAFDADDAVVVIGLEDDVGVDPLGIDDLAGGDAEAGGVGLLFCPEWHGHRIPGGVDARLRGRDGSGEAGAWVPRPDPAGRACRSP